MRTVCLLRLSCGFLSLALALSPLATRALTQGDYTYTVADGKATVTDFNVSFTGSLSITNTLGGYPVASIGGSAFEDCAGLESVIVPSGVTNIANWAFCSCIRLVSVRFGTNVTAIGTSAFYKCDRLAGVLFEGDAPARCTASVFTSDMVTIYRLPNTAGWGATLAGHPVVCWNPQIRSDSGLGFVSGRFGFNVSGTTNIPVVIQVANDLSSGVWTPLLTNRLSSSGVLAFRDPAPTKLPARFYRVIWP